MGGKNNIMNSLLENFLFHSIINSINKVLTLEELGSELESFLAAKNTAVVALIAGGCNGLCSLELTYLQQHETIFLVDVNEVDGAAEAFGVDQFPSFVYIKDHVRVGITG